MFIRHRQDVALGGHTLGLEFRQSPVSVSGRRKFGGALADGQEVAGEKPHVSQRTREMGHPSVNLFYWTSDPVDRQVPGFSAERTKPDWSAQKDLRPKVVLLGAALRWKLVAGVPPHSERAKM